MQSDDILSQLATVFEDIFDSDFPVLTRSLTAADVEGWDSLTNIRLMLRVERHFGIKLTALEIGKLKNVGELVDLISRKTTER